MGRGLLDLQPRASPAVKRAERCGLRRQMDRGLFWRMGHQQFRAHLAGLVAPIVAQISAALEPAVQVLPFRTARKLQVEKSKRLGVR